MQHRPRRLARKLLAVTGLAAFFVGGSILVAAADAPSPVAGTNVFTGTATINSQGDVTVTVTHGAWVWDAAHNCDPSLGKVDRFAAGYAADWNDPSQPGNLVADGIAVGTPTDNNVYWNHNSPCGTVTGKTTAGSFSTGDLVTGQVGTPNSGGTLSPLQHTYVGWGSKPLPLVCLVTYDVHGDATSVSSAKELTAGGTNHLKDNSVETNQDVPGVENGCVQVNLTTPVDVGIHKTGPATAHVGDTVTYDLSVFNDSQTAATDVKLADAQPAGLQFTSVSAPAPWSCTGGNAADISCTYGTALAAAASAPAVTVTAKVLPGAVGSGGTGSVTNTGTVSATGDSDASNNQASVTTTVSLAPQPDVGIHKSGPSSVSVGQVFTYSLSVYNDGPVAASGIAVTDAIPAGLDLQSVSATAPWSCSTADHAVNCTYAGTLAANSTAAQPILVQVQALAAAVPSVTNTGVVSAPGDSNPDNNRSTVTTTVATVPVPDVGVTKTAPAQVAVGDTFAYTLNVYNDSQQPADGVVVTDALPAGVSLQSVSSVPPWACALSSGDVLSCTYDGSLAAGATAPAITVHVTALAAAVPAGATSGQVKNTAVVSATSDSNPGNNTSTVTTTVTAAPPAPTGTMAITKSVRDLTRSGYVAFGDTLEYTLDVTTTGTLVQKSVLVSDEVPQYLTYVAGSGTCSTPGCSGPTSAGRVLRWSLGDLAGGSSARVTFRVVVDRPTGLAPGQAISRTFDNVGTVASTQTPTTPSNHVITTVTEVLGVKITQNSPTPASSPTATLPFTGSAVPVGRAVVDGVLFVLAGLLLMASVKVTPRRQDGTEGRLS